jgi:hypothetical protein
MVRVWLVVLSVFNFSVLGCGRLLNGDRGRFVKGASVTSDNLGWRRHGRHDKSVGGCGRWYD